MLLLLAAVTCLFSVLGMIFSHPFIALVPVEGCNSIKNEKLNSMAFPSCYVPFSDPLLRDGHGDGAHDTDEQDEEDATNVGQAELIHRGPRFFILKWTHQF